MLCLTENPQMNVFLDDTRLRLRNFEKPRNQQNPWITEWSNLRAIFLSIPFDLSIVAIYANRIKF